ncbi:MAG TPA: hypothetical protein VHW96_01275 [Solirubrobacteraceae bacterium]|jgi:hypothetical protein|nr:hypothetical protein [Solirubrobacteraceae bacterium]
MGEFMLELYASRSDRDAVLDRAERARTCAKQVQREGATVRLSLVIFVPEDETCLLVYEAASVERVRHCAHLAGLPVEHIVEAIVVHPEMADVV